MDRKLANTTSAVLSLIETAIWNLPDDELEQLTRVDTEATETNCGWTTYLFREPIAYYARWVRDRQQEQKQKEQA